MNSITLLIFRNHLRDSLFEKFPMLRGDRDDKFAGIFLSERISNTHILLGLDEMLCDRSPDLGGITVELQYPFGFGAVCEPLVAQKIGQRLEPVRPAVIRFSEYGFVVESEILYPCGKFRSRSVSGKILTRLEFLKP